jgi:putative transposase
MKSNRINLLASDRDYLEAYVSKGKHSARSIKRATILLLLNAGKCITDTAKQTHVTATTVYKALARYSGVDGDVREAIKEKARPGRPPKLCAELEANITALACSKAPGGRSQWTLRLLADKIVELRQVETISHEAVRKCLKKVNSNPGRKSSGALGK